MKDNFGHWVVSGKVYHNKLKAVTDAVPNGWWPHFYFHENVFSKHTWTQEPSEGLTELYGARAKYLRKKYDHITLEFSGGADSWTILHSFIQEGIHPDVVSHKYVDVDLGVNNLSDHNQPAEAKYQAWPWYNKFKELAPAMQWKLTQVKDIIVDVWAGRSLDPFEHNIFHSGIITKLADVSMEIMDFIPHTKKSAILYGIDKPNLFFENNKFYLYFPDTNIMHWSVMERQNAGLPIDDVLFYWDKECCKLLTKQAHIVMNWFKKNPSMLPLISSKHHRDQNKYYSIVNSLIYPDFQRTWQSKKSSGVFKLTHEEWFHATSEGTKHGNNWKKSMREYSSVVNDTLCGTQFESYIKKEDSYSLLPSGWSKMYYLGSL